MGDMVVTETRFSNEPGKTLDDYMRGIQTEEW